MLIRNNNWNIKSPKVQLAIPNVYDMYKEGNHLINMRQFSKNLTINAMSLESYETPDHLFFYGAKDIGMPMLNVFKVLSVR